MTKAITVRIMSPLERVFEEQVAALSAENSEGPFDILPDHARFMTLLSPKPITITGLDGSVKTFALKNALLFFEDDTAVIYVQEPISTTA